MKKMNNERKFLKKKENEFEWQFLKWNDMYWNLSEFLNWIDGNKSGQHLKWMIENKNGWQKYDMKWNEFLHEFLNENWNEMKLLWQKIETKLNLLNFLNFFEIDFNEWIYNF